MARLRSPVARSEANTASSTPSSRPAKRLSVSRMSSKAPSPSAWWISPEQAIAPALTIGLNGRLSAVRRIELNASPLGSTPITASTCSAPSISSASANTNALEIDWIVKGAALRRSRRRNRRWSRGYAEMRGSALAVRGCSRRPRRMIAANCSWQRVRIRCNGGCMASPVFSGGHSRWLGPRPWHP